MGYTPSDAPADGVTLDYFKGVTINCDGWTRTPYYTGCGPNGEYMVYVKSSSSYHMDPVYKTGIDEEYVRPTLILPSDMTMD